MLENKYRSRALVPYLFIALVFSAFAESKDTQFGDLRFDPRLMLKSSLDFLEYAQYTYWASHCALGIAGFDAILL